MSRSLQSLAKYVAVGTLIFMIGCGFVMTFWEIHPFFLDEWAIIYNIKYKTHHQLWGHLDKMQQFPRTYLQIVKWFSAFSDFSYWSLRRPSFIVSCCGISYAIYLSTKLYTDTLYRWLWVLIYAAYPASILYFVLTKQYTMEMLMALVGIAQLSMLIGLSNGNKPANWKYALLCISLLFAPSFSYTYPMVAAPIFAIILLNTLAFKKNISKTWLPLICCILGIIMLYLHDIRQVMADSGMKNYWKDYYMTTTFSLTELCSHIWQSFYNFGRGPFMFLLAIIGLSSWLYGTYRSAGIIRKREKTLMEWLVVYSVMLMWLSVFLFIARMLPLNAYRLNAYKTPAVGIMIIYFFMQLQKNKSFAKPVYLVAGGLFALQVLFIVQPLIRDFVEPAHKRKMLIYNNSKTAIATAQEENIPIFTTSMSLYPHEDIDKADWVIKSHPHYKKELNIQVYPINFDYEADSILHTLPYQRAVVTVGDSVFIIEK